MVTSEEPKGQDRVGGQNAIQGAGTKEEEEEEEDYSCGIGSWRPGWMQGLASPKIFLINFSIVAILQGANFTYLIGSTSTLEKRYSFDSKITGFILIADNLSQMVINPFIGYLGTKYNRPRIIAIGETIVALACFLSALPYFMYGPSDRFYKHETNFGDEVSKWTNGTTNGKNYDMCGTDDDALLSNKKCNEPTVWPAVVLLWFASFVNGIGYTAFYTIGLPYLDDNTSKKSSALYLSK